MRIGLTDNLTRIIPGRLEAGTHSPSTFPKGSQIPLELFLKEVSTRLFGNFRPRVAKRYNPVENWCPGRRLLCVHTKITQP